MENRAGKYFASNRLLFTGSVVLILFGHEFVSLCNGYSTFEEFKSALGVFEKRSLFTVLIMMTIGFSIIVIGIKIRPKKRKRYS